MRSSRELVYSTFSFRRTSWCVNTGLQRDQSGSESTILNFVLNGPGERCWWCGERGMCSCAYLRDWSERPDDGLQLTHRKEGKKGPKTTGHTAWVELKKFCRGVRLRTLRERWSTENRTLSLAPPYSKLKQHNWSQQNEWNCLSVCWAALNSNSRRGTCSSCSCHKSGTRFQISFSGLTSFPCQNIACSSHVLAFAKRTHSIEWGLCVRRIHLVQLSSKSSQKNVSLLLENDAHFHSYNQQIFIKLLLCKRPGVENTTIIRTDCSCSFRVYILWGVTWTKIHGSRLPFFWVVAILYEVSGNTTSMDAVLFI